MNLTEKSILQTLAFYECLGQISLTAVELYRYLQKARPNQEPPNFYELLGLLEKSPDLKKLIETKNGFFFLKGNERFAPQRIKRQKTAIGKWRQTEKIVRLIRATPYLRGVIVSGSLALDNTKPKSDIDLLIFAKPGRIWTCRIFLTIFLQILGRRRYDKKIADRICLNHYIAQNNPRISLQNISNAQLYARLIPLAGQENYQFFLKENSWINDFLFFPPDQKKRHRRRFREKKASYRAGLAFQKTAEFVLDAFFGNALEKKLGAWQISRIENKTGRREFSENELCLNENMLLFHYPVCRNTEVMEAYNKKIDRLDLN